MARKSLRKSPRRKVNKPGSGKDKASEKAELIKMLKKDDAYIDKLNNDEGKGC